MSGKAQVEELHDEKATGADRVVSANQSGSLGTQSSGPVQSGQSSGPAQNDPLIELQEKALEDNKRLVECRSAVTKARDKLAALERDLITAYDTAYGSLAKYSAAKDAAFNQTVEKLQKDRPKQ